LPISSPSSTSKPVHRPLSSRKFIGGVSLPVPMRTTPVCLTRSRIDDWAAAGAMAPRNRPIATTADGHAERSFIAVLT